MCPLLSSLTATVSSSAFRVPKGAAVVQSEWPFFIPDFSSIYISFLSLYTMCSGYTKYTFSNLQYLYTILLFIVIRYTLSRLVKCYYLCYVVYKIVLLFNIILYFNLIGIYLVDFEMLLFVLCCVVV